MGKGKDLQAMKVERNVRLFQNVYIDNGCHKNSFMKSKHNLTMLKIGHRFDLGYFVTLDKQ